jgi:hypothetical protein
LDEWALMVLSQNIRSALRRRPALVLLGLSRVVSVTEPVLPALLCVSHTVALCDGQMRTIAPPGVSARHAIVNAGLADRLALRPTLESALAG